MLEYLWHCLFCADDKASKLILSPDVDTAHAIGVNQDLHFGCLYLRNSGLMEVIDLSG